MAFALYMMGDITAASMVDGEVSSTDSTACISVTYIIVIMSLKIYIKYYIIYDLPFELMAIPLNSWSQLLSKWQALLGFFVGGGTLAIIYATWSYKHATWVPHLRFPRGCHTLASGSKFMVGVANVNVADKVGSD